MTDPTITKGEERPTIRPLTPPVVIKILGAATRWLDGYEPGNYHEDRVGDSDATALEAIMEALYGPEVWEWIDTVTSDG